MRKFVTKKEKHVDMVKKIFYSLSHEEIIWRFADIFNHMEDEPKNDLQTLNVGIATIFNHVQIKNCYFKKEGAPKDQTFQSIAAQLAKAVDIDSDVYRSVDLDPKFEFNGKKFGAAVGSRDMLTVAITGFATFDQNELVSWWFLKIVARRLWEFNYCFLDMRFNNRIENNPLILREMLRLQEG
jgi:hypothetical protein